MKDHHRLIEKLRTKESRLIIGLMSGTSADGVTAALTEIKGTGKDTEIKLHEYRTYPYPEEMRRRVFDLFNPQRSTVTDVCKMNFAIGEAFAEAVNRLLKDTGYVAEQVDLVGSHGQTVWHQPKATKISGYSARSTLQLGEPATISTKTGLPVVADFRKADIAAVGQGAPLTPYLDWVLHRHPTKNRVLQNIGGIANITYLPADCEIDDIVAFDTGPGNMVIDAAMKHFTGKPFDANGEYAEKGTPNQTLLDTLLSHPYYKQKPPKTTGREEYGEQYTAEVIRKAENLGLTAEDIVATVTKLTADTIADAYESYLPGQVDEVYVSGGGARNRVLVDWLRDRINARVYDYSALGFPSETKESVLIALLANEYVMGTPCNVPSATGAERKVCLGYLTWV